MMNIEIVHQDSVCPYCGIEYFYDQGLNCDSCSSRGCMFCVTVNPHRMCPECGSEKLIRIRPMLAKLSELPKSDNGWNYEYKWDGVRAMCYWDGHTLKFESRNGNNITARYPELNGVQQDLEEPAVIDGEIVAFDKNAPSFSLLQRRMHAGPGKAEKLSKSIPVYYFMFDIVFYGEPVMNRTYLQRRKILAGLNISHPNYIIAPTYTGQGSVVLQAAKNHNMEGIICKKSDSVYEPGKRSGKWRKVKVVKSEELVIGGWVPQKDTRNRIGALLLGYFTSDMKLVYCGSVGTGFDEYDNSLLISKLSKLYTGEKPFYNSVSRKNVNFVSPVLVAEVEYRRWPEGGCIQQASYKGLRTDKEPAEVVIKRNFVDVC